jgi:hypothetical protein
MRAPQPLVKGLEHVLSIHRHGDHDDWPAPADRPAKFPLIYYPNFWG